MKIKTSELIGPALDWAVAQITGEGFYLSTDPDLGRPYWYSPSSVWSQGGPIIEREGIQTTPVDGIVWAAIVHKHIFDDDLECFQTGLTPLIAAMRCYVASKLGDEVEIPEELNF